MKVKSHCPGPKPPYTGMSPFSVSVLLDSLPPFTNRMAFNGPVIPQCLLVILGMHHAPRASAIPQSSLCLDHSLGCPSTSTGRMITWIEHFQVSFLSSLMTLTLHCNYKSTPVHTHFLQVSKGRVPISLLHSQCLEGCPHTVISE